MNKDIAERIAELRRERGLNQDELAEMVGVHRVTIAKYETGRIEPGAQVLNKIADALEISTDELFGRADRISPFIVLKRNAVPVVGSIACGKPVTPDTNAEGYADLPEGVRADFALRCNGDSMNPTFIDGDLVLIRQQPEVENGQIAAVGVDGETMLKHIYKQPEGVLCVSDNPKFAPQFFHANSAPVVYGLAVGFIRNLS